RLSSGYWFKETADDGGTRVINIATLKTGGSVAGVTLYEFRAGQELASFSQAKEGRFKAGELILNNVTETRIADNAVEALKTTQPPQGALTQILSTPERTLKTTLTPERLIARV